MAEREGFEPPLTRSSLRVGDEYSITMDRRSRCGGSGRTRGSQLAQWKPINVSPRRRYGTTGRERVAYADPPKHFSWQELFDYVQAVLIAAMEFRSGDGTLHAMACKYLFTCRT